MTRLRPFYAPQGKPTGPLETGYECNRDIFHDLQSGIGRRRLGSGAYFWRKTSTNPRTAQVKKASTGFSSGPANYSEQHYTSHEQDLHERLPLLYKYVSHAISPYLRTPQGYVYRDACCRSTTIATARR
jgi:hypothetical protein